VSSDRPTVLAVIGDIHAHAARLGKVLARIERERVDGILLVGDLGHPSIRPRRPDAEVRERYLASVEEVLRRVGAVGVGVLWVPGNHDLPDVPGTGNVDGRVGKLAGLRVHGIGGAGPEPFGFAYEWDEDAIRRRPEPPCDVLLCHAPPARTDLDWVPTSRAHVGSEAIRERALRHRGVLVCGHIHESPGAVQLGSCICINVGGLGEPFGRAQVGFVRWDPGGAHEVVHEDLEESVVRTWGLVPG